ncbi:hypothetical protein LQZ18_03185 [Lachnospiraceae bacterium ZAX-1]
MNNRKKSTSKVITVIVIVAIFMMIESCGKEKVTESDTVQYEQGYSDVSAVPPDADEGSDDEYASIGVAPSAEDSDSFTGGALSWYVYGDFKEGLAEVFAYLNTESDEVPEDGYMSIINKQGQILFSDNIAWEPCYDYAYTASIICRHVPDLYRDIIKEAFDVMDFSGNITYSNPELHFLGISDEFVLVGQHVSNFDTNEFQIGAIDIYGNVIVPFKAYEEFTSADDIVYDVHDTSFQHAEYIGDGAFKVDTAWGYIVLIDTNAQKCISLEGYDLVADFEDGQAVIVDDDGIYYVRTNGEIEKFAEPVYSSLYGPDIVKNFSEGLAFVSDPYEEGDGSYYRFLDYYGNTVIDISHIKNLYTANHFNEGYSVLRLTGADGNAYINVIDRNGNELFSPIPVDDDYGEFSGFSDTVQNGYIFYLSMEGDIVFLNVQTKEIVYTIPDAYIYGDMYISDGMFGYGDVYVNLDAGTTIGEE